MVCNGGTGRSGPPAPGKDVNAVETKRKMPITGWVVIVVGLVALLCMGVAIIGLINPEPEPVRPATGPAGKGGTGSAPAPVAKKDDSYRVGESFRSGDFRYTVHGVKTGVDKVGSQYTEHRAQGQFVRLDLSVTNVSDKPSFFVATGLLRVEDGRQREFSPDVSAMISGNKRGSDLWVDEVNPGNTTRGYVFFDLPKDATADRLVVAAGVISFEADALVALR